MDYVGFVVGNATQTAQFYQLAFGMDLEAYSGPETGNRDAKSYVLRSGSARFVFTGGVTPGSPVLDHHRKHGDGVVDLAMEVPDVDKCIEHARAHGRHDPRRAARRDRRARHRPHRRDRDVRRDPPHADRPLAATTARSCPGTSPHTTKVTRREGHPKRLFQAIDHCVGNVELGRMDEWVEFYNRSSASRTWRSSSATTSPPTTPR